MLDPCGGAQCATGQRVPALRAMDQLQALDHTVIFGGQGDGAEPILLSWESHEESDYCHRRLVAEWFKRTLGKQVTELKVRN
jgi:hypothetical protein